MALKASQKRPGAIHMEYVTNLERITVILHLSLNIIQNINLYIKRLE